MAYAVHTVCPARSPLSACAAPIAAVFLFVLLCAPAATNARDLATWTLRENLGHQWQNELVFFPVNDKGCVAGQEPQFSVVDDDQQPLEFQFWQEPGTTRRAVALLIDLPAYATRTFTLRDTVAAAPTPNELALEETPDSYVMKAGWYTQVRIPRSTGFQSETSFAVLPAPILAVVGADARWLGRGTLSGEFPVQTFTTILEARGPVFLQARIRYDFGPRKFYQMRIRVIAGEDVVLVEEDSALSAAELAATPMVVPPDLAPETGTPSPLTDWLVNQGMGWNNVVTDTSTYPCFRFNFCAGWNADRVTKYDLNGGKTFTRSQLTKTLTDWRLGLVLTPFQARGRRVTASGFRGGTGRQDVDCLGVFSRFLGRWTHANENRVPMPWLDDGVTAHFFAFEGHREWGLATAEPVHDLPEKNIKHGKSTFSVIRRAQVRHGETPLDKVKDWVLEWDLPTDARWPRLYYSADSVARMKRDYPRLAPEIRELIEKDAAAYALLTDNEPGLRQAFDRVASLRVSVDAFVNGGHNTVDTYTHRFQEIVRGAVPVVDIGLASSSVTEQERKRALALVAFLAYKISDPDYWAYHAYGGGPSNPNMMSIATNALAMCAALCVGHPQQQEWFELCKRLVCADILGSIGPRGAWLESPGYQGAGNNPVNMTVLILRNAGAADLVRDPVFGRRLLSVSTYWANLLTPPDPRFDGRRMPMALGDNTPFFANMYTYLAHSGRDAFPVQAGNALWAWEQMGRPAHSALMLLNEHVFDDTVKPVAISGNTEVFPGFGVMFRHGFGTKHETFMTLRQSPFAYGHYDEDQGSFSLFAKGAPLCLDWIDYSPGAPEHHNRVDYGADINPWLVPKPDCVTLTEDADYVRVHQNALPKGTTTRSNRAGQQPAWQRQVILVKDPEDPGDATYIVVRDRVTGNQPTTWNLWTMAVKDSAEVDGNIVRLKGQFGVDLTVFFFRKPAPALRTDFLHHQTRSYIKTDQDQTRVQASCESGGDYGVVLYPLRRGIDVEPTVRELDAGTVELKWPNGRRHLVVCLPDAPDVSPLLNGRLASIVKRDNGEEFAVVLE